MVTVEFVDANGNTCRFTVTDTVAFQIIDALKESPKVKKISHRHWVEVYERPAGS